MSDRFEQFIAEVTSAVSGSEDESVVLPQVRAAMARLVAKDDWLPADKAQADPERYQQNLLHCDADGRFSVVCFVWGPGQQTPIHDHMMWGVIGMLRGAEICIPYRLVDGKPERHGDEIHIRPGDVGAVSPTIGDIHQVRNALTDRPSISIHCYGGDIGKVERHSFTAGSRTAERFVSGYSNVAS